VGECSACGVGSGAESGDPSAHELGELLPPADQQAPMTSGRDARRETVEPPRGEFEAGFGDRKDPPQSRAQSKSPLQPLAQEADPLRHPRQP